MMASRALPFLSPCRRDAGGVTCPVVGATMWTEVVIAPRFGNPGAGCSRACLRIAREVMRSGHAVQGLNESRYRFPPGLFGAAGRQRDKEVVRSIRMRAIKLEVRSDVSRLFAETRAGMHHFAGDGMDLAWRQTLGMLALAAP